MDDELRSHRVWLMIKIWFYLEEKGTVWPPVKKFLEEKINEELGG